MHNRLIKYLKRPYSRQIKPIETILIASGIVFFLLAVFQPFGLNMIKENKLLILLGFMFVTAFCLSIQCYIFPVIWKKFYKKGNWTIGKELSNMLLTVLLISLGNSLYSLYVFSQEINLLLIGYYLIVTFLISIFPITLSIFLVQNRQLTENLRAITEMNNQLNTSSERSSVRTEKIISIMGSGKECIELDINKLLYIEANSNYVKICFTDKEKVSKKLLRATIKQMEESLNEFSSIVKCHRAFLVNVNAIREVQGNSQGYRLFFDGVEEDIPVSRAYTKEFKEQISHIKSNPA